VTREFEIASLSPHARDARHTPSRLLARDMMCIAVFGGERQRRRLDRGNPRAANSIRRAQNEALHRLGETFVVVGVRRYVGLLFHFIGGIAHGNA
jgi:hypothetical protein